MILARHSRYASAGAGAPVPPARDGANDAAVDLHAPILIVEDEVMIAWMLQTLLEEAGFDAVVIASDGDSALAEAARLRPALLISDINLGAGIDGVEVATRIAGGAGTPVLFVSAHADNAARVRIAEDVPCAVLLCKPVDAAAFTAAVFSALAPQGSRH